MKKITLFSGLFLIVFISTFAVVDRAEASHSWGGYHWARTANPFTLQLGDNLSSVWKASLFTTSADWSESSVLDTSIQPGHGGKNCSATTGRVEVCNRKYGNNGWLGLAQIWISGNHITKGVVKVNDTYFNTSKYNNPNEKLHVMCQEVGHTLGLDHQSEDGSSQNTCMDYFSNTGANALSTISTHPNPHDYEQLVLIYEHLDSINTVFDYVGDTGGGKPGKGRPLGVGLDIDLSSPSAWGRVVSEGAGGRSSLYERNIGWGEKLFTFVTWVE